MSGSEEGCGEEFGRELFVLLLPSLFYTHLRSSYRRKRPKDFIGSFRTPSGPQASSECGKHSLHSLLRTARIRRAICS